MEPGGPAGYGGAPSRPISGPIVGPGGPQGPQRPGSRPVSGPVGRPVSGTVGADGLERGPGPAPWPVQHPMNAAPRNAAPPSTLPTHPASVAVAPPSRVPSRPVTGIPASAPPQSGPPAMYVPAPERYPALDPADPVEPERERDERPNKKQKPRRVKSRPPKDRKDRQAVHELELREIAGHLTFTRNDVTAWYHLPDIQWAFRADKERTSILLGIAAQYAALGGYRLHMRRTNRPYPAVGWARRMAALTPHPVPDVRGAPSWSDHLEAGQRRLHATSLAEGEVYLGVVFQRRTMREQMIETLNALRKRGSGNAERNRLEQLVGRFDEVLGAFGMQARPATAKQVEWLIHRSVALCMPPPPALSPAESGGWETGDLLAFTEHTMRYRSPYGSTVKLQSRIGDEYVERHVAVLTFGRMEELSIPERHEPWLHFHEQLPWPMEISSRVDVLGQGDALRSLEHKLLTIRSQQRDYHEHEMDAPPELERLAQRALDISDEMSTGLDLDAARVHGWHRIAVSGRTEEECLKRARALTDHYRSIRMTLNHPRDQLRLLDEFIPGQPVANTGYLRRMPAKYFAAAIPQAAAAIGDRRGPIIGETCGTSHRPVMWDPHYATEVRERSGLAVFVAEPGGGKSTLMGGIAYLAARRGVQCTILDPSGPLARLATMPELAPFSKVYNLTRGEPGTLAPYGLIPTPRREHFPAGALGDAEWTSAVAAARAERKALATDICMMLLPPQIQRERSSPILLQRAARQVEPEEWATLDDLIATVATFGDEGSELAETLGDVRDMPLSRLFFGRSTASYGQDESVLTVITMAGLALPDLTIDREFWQLEERMALPMLHLATAFTTRRAYGRAMHERKLVALDETHFLAGWGSGRALFTRLARDSRKWNIAALAASQNPVDILGLDVQNLVSTVFVGRIAEDPEIAAQALRMLGVQRGIGYENTLAQLSVADSQNDQRLGYREFVMRDVDGRVQKFRADLAYVAGLLEHLDTTADPLGDVGRIAGQEGDAR
ncbi:ATP-binding protein [Cryptosporangium sp. NPDC051539]|uniref:ATP-binding protein n=1 Tax=Cryptosporangium sp. NPDC051539 TaxID=3363962 RepID=UPI0037B8DD10